MSDDTENEFPRQQSTGSHKCPGYTVEARSVGGPLKVGDLTLGNEWERIPFHRSIIGVPCAAHHESGLKYVNLLNYPAAQALRWWFHAEAHKEAGWLSLRTRIVKHEVQINHTVTAVSAHCEVGGEDRSALAPDWGAKPEVPAPIEKPDTAENTGGDK
jgi:hypothetical protein